MKRAIALLFLLMAFTSIMNLDEYVNGYYDSRGNYVQGYYRTDPNETRNDNYSHKGNTNPYTGQRGSKN